MMSKTLRLSDGTAARILEAGPADGVSAGAPLLLVHGVGLRAEAWAPQIAALSDRMRVIAVDMPGHGESDPLPVTARLPDYVAWAARVIAALGAGPVNVAGHSMGALIACGLAVEHPELVRRVALLNGVHRRSEEARAAVRARADLIARGEGDAVTPLSRWFGPEELARAPGLRDLVAGWLLDVSQAGYATAYRAFSEGDAVYADRLCEVRCPALILTGDGDGNSTAEMTEVMARAMPLGRASVIAGHRHMVNLTAPEAVNAAMIDWLATEETPA